MRKLWEDHVTWTRLAIVTFADGVPRLRGHRSTADAEPGRHRRRDQALLRRRRRGAAHPLLKDHIGSPHELLQAAKAGDDQAFQDGARPWYHNADDIAGFLAKANPRDWPKATMRAAMRTHLDQTLAEAQP